MKVIILAGGKGTRLAEYTSKVPKPMVKINKKPIITYIIDHYIKYGAIEVLIAAGYKYHLLKNYFLFNKKKYPNVKVLDTGLNSLTAKRILKLKKNFKKGEDFFMTYGDGVADLDLSNLLKHHKKNKKICTLTAVRPIARFGELQIKGNTVHSFNEKPQLKQGWINGGFFVLNYKIFQFLDNKNQMFEREPMQKLLKKKNVNAFKHNGFWMCMDTLRDKILLEKIIQNYV
jgi:glucose-1-phosphate cytidylyltransferase